jgi:predicted nucleic acid-binding protein
MSASRSKQKADTGSVVDANVFVPALAGKHGESVFLSSAIRAGWMIVVNDALIDEYIRLVNKHGFPASVVHAELWKLQDMKKLLRSTAPWEDIDEDLAPRKDRHVVAPAKSREANRIVTHDRGIHALKENIRRVTKAVVLYPAEATKEILRDEEDDSDTNR